MIFKLYEKQGSLHYEVLDKSNISGIETLITDSLSTEETEYNYVQTFSKKDYVEWLKWDSVFEPTYKILEIKQKNGTVKAKISKTDKRIIFLHQEPIVTDWTCNKKLDFKLSDYAASF